MEKKNLIITIAFLLTVSAAIAQSKKASVNNYNVDSFLSTFKWQAHKVFGSHNGKVSCKEGLIMIKDSILSGATIIIDMTSIDNADLSGNSRDALMTHLKSDDFFEVEKFKTAAIKIKSAKEIQSISIDGKNYEILADLTIKGITKEIKFRAIAGLRLDKIYVEASLDIDRTEFGIRYASKKFFKKIADAAIADKFNLAVSIVANKAD